MNWNHIKNKHPKAWDLLTKDFTDEITLSAGQLNLVDDGYSVPYNTRDLYDFFDEQGIFINTNAIEIKYGGCQDCYEVQGFGIEIVSKETHILFEEHTKEDKSIWCGVSPIHTTRTDAEIVAYTKAFQILEDKLNK